MVRLCSLSLLCLAAACGRARAEAALRPDRDRPAPVLDARYPAHGVAFHFLAHVYEKPDKRSRAVGYLRRGGQFRASEELGRQGCAGGWFEIPGPGYVCRGDGVWIDSQPRTYDAAAGPAALASPLPYPYAKIVAPDVPQFFAPPSPEEERQAQAELAQRAQLLREAQDAGLTSDAGPDAGADAGAPPLPSTVRQAMQPGYYVSLDPTYPADQPFARTVRGGFIRADRLVPAEAPPAVGVRLGARHRLPLAFVYRGGARRLQQDALTGRLATRGEAALHSAHDLTGEAVARGGRRYLVTRTGDLLRDTAVRVAREVARPPGVPAGARWIHVNLYEQTLVAYEGDRPVFATLVSSGLPGHDTPLGLYRIYAKHVTTTMADELAADGPYSIEDVPWTMYFRGSYALHAAFWHNRFGRRRSHGCVNLAPRDARWLFFWTLPQLPSAWHGVLADVGQGSWVWVDDGQAG